jgi:hypothetical protein
MKLNKIARVLLLAAAYAGITTSSWAVANAVSGHPGDHDEARQVRHVGYSRQSGPFGPPLDLVFSRLPGTAGQASR